MSEERPPKGPEKIAGSTVEFLISGEEREEQDRLGSLLDPADPDGPDWRTGVTTEADGRYETLDPIGAGGMGAVTAVSDRHLARIVARKSLHHELLAGPAGTRGPLSRFLAEARVVAGLEHPGIPPVHELGLDAQGAPYFTMKRVQGETLAQAIEARPGLSERLALLGPMVQVCQAVAFAHERGVIHRDLKPDNIMLGAFGEALVLDWGLARTEGELSDAGEAQGTISGSDQTRAGAVMGTPAYMSPEQARGLGATPRSDVWSLGVVLYEVLTGTSPFWREDVRTTLKAVRAAQVPTLRLQAPQVPRDLAAIVHKALQPEPGCRHETAAELAADLEAWRVGDPVRAYRYSALERTNRFVARHRGAVTAVVGALVVLLGVAAVAVQRVRGERDLAQAAEARTHEALRRVEVRALVSEAARAELGDRAPQGVALLQAAASLAEESAPLGVDGARMASAAGLPLVLARGPASWLTALAVSPDGAQLAAAGAEGAVRRWDLSTGTQTEVRPVVGHVVRALIWHPTGSALLVGGADGSVRHLGPDGETLLGSLEGTVVVLDVSPDGDRLVAGTTGGQVGLFDLSGGGTAEVLAGSGSGIRALAFSPDGRWLVAAGGQGRLQVWDEQGQVRTLRHHQDGVNQVAWSPDAAWFVSAGDDGHVVRWRPDTGEMVDIPAVLMEREPSEGAGLILSMGSAELTYTGARRPVPVRRLAVSARGAVAYGHGRRADLQTADGRVHTLVHEGSLSALGFSPDGRLLVTGDADGWLTAWDTATGAALQRSRLRRAPGWVQVSPDGTQVALLSGQDDVLVWSLPSERRRRTLPGQTASVGRVEVGGQDRVVTGADDGSIVVHGEGGPLSVRGGSEVTALAVSAPADRLAAGHRSGRVVVHRVSDGALLLAQDGADPVRGVAFTGRDQLSALGLQGSLRQWDLATGAMTDRGDVALPAAALAFQGAHLAAAGYGEVRLWRPETTDEGRALAFEGQGMSVGLSPDASRVAVGTADGRLITWRLPEGSPVLELQAHVGPVDAIVPAPAGPGWITAGADGRLRAWDEDGKRLWSTDEGARIIELARHADGRRGVVVDHVGRVRVVDLGSGGLLAATTVAGARAVRWLGDDEVVVTGQDGLVLIWRAEVGAPPRTNLRVCRQDHRVVPVVPYPDEQAVWAPESACVE